MYCQIIYRCFGAFKLFNRAFIVLLSYLLVICGIPWLKVLNLRYRNLNGHNGNWHNHTIDCGLCRVWIPKIHKPLIYASRPGIIFQRLYIICWCLIHIIPINSLKLNSTPFTFYKIIKVSKHIICMYM